MLKDAGQLGTYSSFSAGTREEIVSNNPIFGGTAFFFWGGGHILGLHADLH